jgi:hypothetical protein
MKTKTRIKSGAWGGGSGGGDRKLVVKSGLKAGGFNTNHNQKMRVKSGLKAGGHLRSRS